jgi:hypothetical protein
VGRAEAYRVRLRDERRLGWAGVGLSMFLFMHLDNSKSLIYLLES